MTTKIKIVVGFMSMTIILSSHHSLRHEEMNTAVLEVARNAGQASEQGDGTRKKAEEGVLIVNDVVASIN